MPLRVAEHAGATQAFLEATNRGMTFPVADARAALGDLAGDLPAALKRHCPRGVDVYFDNVGGDHLEAALDVLAPFGRAAICGAIGQYNATKRQAGPDNMTNILRQKLRVQGFIVSDHAAEAGKEFQRVAGEWFADGKLVYDETVVNGIDNSVDAFLGLLRGENTGKMVVKI